jgi:hypothetical protein
VRVWNGCGSAFKADATDRETEGVREGNKEEEGEKCVRPACGAARKAYDAIAPPMAWT